MIFSQLFLFRQLRKTFASKFLLTRSILDISRLVHCYLLAVYLLSRLPILPATQKLKYFAFSQVLMRMFFQYTLRKNCCPLVWENYLSWNESLYLSCLACTFINYLMNYWTFVQPWNGFFLHSDSFTCGVKWDIQKTLGKAIKNVK